jgi:transposase
VKLLGISKRGDGYIRNLLVLGARSVLYHTCRPGRTPQPWLRALRSRRPTNVVVVALANKMARIIWALLAHGRTYDSGWRRAQPLPCA